MSTIPLEIDKRTEIQNVSDSFVDITSLTSAVDETDNYTLFVEMINHDGSKEAETLVPAFNIYSPKNGTTIWSDSLWRVSPNAKLFVTLASNILPKSLLSINYTIHPRRTIMKLHITAYVGDNGEEINRVLNDFTDQRMPPPVWKRNGYNPSFHFENPFGLGQPFVDQVKSHLYDWLRAGDFHSLKFIVEYVDGSNELYFPKLS